MSNTPQKMGTILVADRNPHIREFLKRELVAEGYEVFLAKGGKEVVEWAYGQEPLDLVILDPDLPDAGEVSVLEKLKDRIPALPVIVHTYSAEYMNGPSAPFSIVFVEKKGASVEHLKRVVQTSIKKPRAETKNPLSRTNARL